MIERRPELALFALVFGVYVYFYQGGGWNQNSRFDLSRALVEDRALVIDRFVSNTGDLSRLGDHYYCDKAPGVSIAGSLPYGLVYAIAGSRNPSPRYLAWSLWLMTIVTVALPSALAVVALAFALGALGVGARARSILALAWGLATLALPYSTLYYGHQVAAALLAIAFALLVGVARTEHRSRGVLVAIGIASGWAVVVEYPVALALVAFAIYAMRKLRARDLVWIAIGGLAPLAIFVAYHTLAFGAPWRLAYSYSTQHPRHVGFMGIGWPRLRALKGLTVTPFRGLFFTAPWLVLALPGGERLWRSGARAETLVCAAIAVLFLWLNASLVDWNGGWAIGPRYLVPCIPFLVVLVAGYFAPQAPRLPRGALVVGGLLVAWSVVLMLAATAVEPEVDDQIRRPFGEVILPSVLHGKLSISQTGVEMDGPVADGKRHAWNLGQLAGLPGLWSLLPLLLWSGAWGWILWRRIGKTDEKYAGLQSGSPGV